MKKLFDRVAERLGAFVVQREMVALVVRSRTAEAPILLKILEGVADGSTSDLYWIFTDEFTSPREYAPVVVGNFAVQYEAIRMAMEKEGMTPPPPLPGDLFEESVSPERRLREAMAFSRTLIPVPGGGQSVWVLFPLQEGVPVAFRDLMRNILRHDLPYPWCHNIRVILRDDEANGGFTETLEGEPRIDWYEPDLSQQAMESAVEEEAADAGLPIERRLQALLLLAGTDIAHKRYTEALEKYRLMLPFYAKTDNPAMAALVLNGIGECHERLGDAGQAEACFTSALGPGCEAVPPPIPILLNIFLNLANLLFAQSRWEEAEAYYDGAEKLATAQLMPGVKIRSMENLGIARYMQGKTAEGLRTWTDAAEMAKNVEETELRRSLLSRVRDHYTASGEYGERERTEKELADLPSPRGARG